MEVNNPEKTYQNSSEEFQLPITLPQPTINPPEIFKNHSIENTSDNIEKNGDFFEFLNDESKISNFLEKLERTEV